jgi:hypothetical protein
MYSGCSRDSIGYGNGKGSRDGPDLSVGMRRITIQGELSVLFGGRVDQNAAGLLSPDSHDRQARCGSERRYDSCSVHDGMVSAA